MAPLALPEMPAVCAIPPAAIRFDRDSGAGSATSLDTFVTCPLRWVLEGPIGLRSGAIPRVLSHAQLYGTLGHRLVEELFAVRAFELPEDSFVTHARETLRGLLVGDGASLLLPGMTFERTQLEPQLLRAARSLHRHLAESGNIIVAVEETTETPSILGILKGRLDLRLRATYGKTIILELKWGESRYRALVEQGRAVQLTVYAHAVSHDLANVPHAAGYFSLRSAAS